MNETREFEPESVEGSHAVTMPPLINRPRRGADESEEC